MTLKGVSFSRIFIFISLFVSAMTVAAPYNRQNCDATIGVERYIHAGSLDDESVGGKTYNFNRIVSALENEVLTNKPANPKKFRCLDDLFEKAKEDATTYWVNRIGNTSCVDDSGRTPSVKPESCNQDLWDEFHKSMNHITAAEKRKKAIPASCKLLDGKNRCEPNSGLQALAASAQPLASAQSDNCCDKENGPAFRVLKTFYTVDLGKLSNDELQRECYKRTQPNQEYGAFGWEAIKGCLSNAFKGIAESIKKMLTSAASLLDVGLWSEISRVLGKAMVSSEGRADLMSKMGSFFEEVGKQIFSQVYASTSCFTGAYQTQQVCRLMTSLVTDYVAGGGAVKLLSRMAKWAGKTTPAQMAKEAAEWIKETPAAQKMQSQMAKISEGAKNVKIQTQVAAKSTVASTKSLSLQLASKMNQSAAIKDSVAKMIKSMKDKLKGNNDVPPVEIGSNLRGPNASTVVEVTSPPPAPRTLSASIVESKQRVGNIVERYKPGKTPSENVFGDLGFGKTKPSKSARAERIKEQAQAARDDVAALKKAGQYSDTKAADALKAIDEMELALQNKLAGKPAAVAAPETSAPVSAVDSARASTKQLINSQKEIDTIVRGHNLKRTPNENALGDIGVGKKVVSAKERMTRIEAKARDARAKIDALKASGRYTEAQAARARTAVDNIENSLRKKLVGDKTPDTSPEVAVEKPAGTSVTSTVDNTSSGASLKIEGDVKPISTAEAPTSATASGGAPTGSTVTAQIGTPTVAPSAINFPSFDIGTALKSGATPTGSTATRWNGLSDFVKKAQEQATKPTPNMQSVYGQRGYWGITKDSIRRHADVEEMYRKGLVNENTALSLHHIIATTEQMAKNSVRPSMYGTRYITAPNARLTALADKTKQVAKPTAAVTSRTLSGQYMSARQYENISDPRYDNDTLNQAINELDKTVSDKDSIAKKFANLQSAGAIKNQATRLLAQAKALEAYVAKFGDDAQKNDVAAFIAQITQERDKALERLVKDGKTERGEDTPAAEAPNP